MRLNSEQEAGAPIRAALAEVERDPRAQRALADVRRLILERFPSATFTVARRTDPAGIYLYAAIEGADSDDVLDPVIDRLFEAQVEELLPVHVIPIRR